jgi:hypothetical protein
MVKTAMAICLASTLAGCVTDEPTDDGASIDDPIPGDEGDPPTPVAPVAEIEWDISDVEIIALQDLQFLPDTAAVQIRLFGSFEADGGTEVAIGVGPGQRNGHPRSNYGWWSWDEPSINSDDYTSGWCGSFETIQTTRGLICRAPGAPGTRQRTTWVYRQLERFEVTPEGASELDFYVTAYGASDEILCDRIVVTRTGSGASPTTTFPECRP